MKQFRYDNEGRKVEILQEVTEEEYRNRWKHQLLNIIILFVILSTSSFAARALLKWQGLIP